MCAAVVFITFFLICEMWIVGASKNGCPDVVLRNKNFAKIHNGTCYLFVNHERFWNDARKSCWNMGGEMASITDYHTMSFIRTVLNSRKLGWSKEGVWLGAKYTDGIWQWTTGIQVDYANWAPGEPSKILGLFSVEDCALMRRGDNWRWHDYLCSTANYRYNYICQFPVENSKVTTTASTTTITQSSSRAGGHQGYRYQAGQVLNDEPVSVGVDVKPGGDGSYRQGNKRGQGVNSMVLDGNDVRDARDPPRGYPAKPRPAFPGYNEVHPASPSQSNENLMILTIILAAGGIVLLVLLLIFLIVRKRYNYKKFIGHPAVHFENRNFSHGHSEPPAPKPHSFHRALPFGVLSNPLDSRMPQPLPVNHSSSHNVPYAVLSDPSDLYLTPQKTEDIYEEVGEPNVADSDPDMYQGSVAATRAHSDEALGACGGASQHNLDQSSTPLISAAGGAALWGESEESLHSMSGSLTLKTSSIHNDYVDMNGSPVVPARNTGVEPVSKSESGEKEDPKDYLPKNEVEESGVVGEGKRHYDPSYSNLMTTSQERCQNLYAQLQ